MQLLEKITLYDILGYALPGGILLYIIKGYDVQQEFSTFGIIVFIAMGYLVGILISQLAAWVTGLVEKIPWFKANMWKKVGLKPEMVSKALEKAKMHLTGKTFKDEENVWKHFNIIYSDIQTDTVYRRIHNYASAALLYKNMAAVSLACAVKYGLERNYKPILVSLLIAVIFAMRWYRFETKKKGYAINWYVEKYR